MTSVAAGGDFSGLWRRLLVLVDVIAMLCGCVAVIALYVRPGLYGDFNPDSRELIVHVYGSPTFDLVAIGCVVLLLLNAVLLMRWRRPRQPLRTVPSTAAGGTTVRVERGALEAGLRAAAEDLDVVHRARVAVDQDGPKRLRIRAFFQCPEGVTILAASEQLRTAMDARFEEMVRLPDGMRATTEIEFIGFSGKLQRKPEPAPEPESKGPAPEPFRGPQYPIEDEHDNAS